MTSSESGSVRTGRWVVSLALILGLVNYLDRVVISYAIGGIQADFGVDNASFGLAMSLFAAGTLAVNGVSGLLLDRFGARVVWSVGLFIWTVAMFLLGLVEYWWLFLMFREWLAASGSNLRSLDSSRGS